MTSETDTPEAALFELPARLDTDTAQELRDDLSALRGAPIQLQGTEVSHLGAKSLGVLIAAAKTWADDGHAMSLVDPSDALLTGAERMGADMSIFGIEEVAS